MKVSFLMTILLLTLPALAEKGKSCCSADKVATKAQATSVDIPDIAVVDQDGRQRKLFSDLIAGKTVAVSFIFTTCTTICPPIGANMAKLAKSVTKREDIALISISIDPLTDTPQRLKAWKANFEGGDNWQLVTGAKTDIDKALKGMGFYTADKIDHSPFILIGHGKHFERVNGFTEPKKLVDMLITAAGEKQAEVKPAGRWFSDVLLTDQHGKQQRLYSDLIQDKIIIMQSFFTSCKTVCPVTVATFEKIQERLGDRLGKDVYLLSISVDPETDTGEVLAEFSKKWQARPGWFFLSGEGENVRTALTRFGQMVENREGHSNIFIIGNDRTGLWKKAFGLADADQVYEVVASVLADRG